MSIAADSLVDPGMPVDPATDDPTSEAYHLRHNFLARRPECVIAGDPLRGLSEIFWAGRTDAMDNHIEAVRLQARVGGHGPHQPQYQRPRR